MTEPLPLDHPDYTPDLTETPEVGAEQRALQDAQRRVEECSLAIRDILAKHGCRIQPYTQFDTVGNQPGGKMLQTPMFDIVPLAPE